MFERFVPSKISISLLIKAAVFGVLLLYVQRQDFAVLPTLLFLAFGVYLYMSPIFKTSSMLTSLIVLLTLSILVTSQFALSLRHAGLATGLPLGIIFFSLAFAVLFYLLLGIKIFLFARRRQWQYVLYLCFVYLAGGLFFNSLMSTSFLFKIAMLFAFLVVMLKEFFRFQEHTKSLLMNVGAVTVAFILVELAWALSLLPIGFSALASVLVVSAYMLTECTHRYMRGDLTARFIRLNSALFLALLAIIFFSSHWTL